MFSIIAYILIPLLVLSVLVFVHELGHFYAARKVGVRVEEFGFGIPPKIIGKKIGETLYTLNLLPFGGFVKLSGEDQEYTNNDYLKDPKNFLAKTPGQRAFIVMAGVVMNVLLAIVLYYGFLAFNGYKSFALPRFFDYNFRFGNQEHVTSVVAAIKEGSPAELAGIQPGEAVLEISGEPVYNNTDINKILADKQGQQVTIILRDITESERPIRNVKADVIAGPDGKGIIGIYVGEAVFLDYSHNKIMSGVAHTYNITAYTLRTFGNLVANSFATGDAGMLSSSVSGPVGVFTIVGSIVQSGNSPVLSLIDLVALLSLTLAVINSLPIPALDGGRFLFILIEKGLGKRVSPNIEMSIHRAGMLLLLGLIVLITIRDISRLI